MDEPRLELDGRYPDYDSPFRAIFEELPRASADQIDNLFYQKVIKLGIDIDKDKLVAALKQDSERYKEAYRRGYVTAQNEDWVTDHFPEKTGDYLVTLFSDSIMENYVIPCRYEQRPNPNPHRFYDGDRDISEYVIAWIKFPEPYDKTHDAILSEEEDSWDAHHL